MLSLYPIMKTQVCFKRVISRRNYVTDYLEGISCYTSSNTWVISKQLTNSLQPDSVQPTATKICVE